MSMRILAVIPVYNHAATLRRVAEDVLRLHPYLLVVDDGSTDLPLPENGILPPEHPLYGLPLFFLRHARNRGKGAAILSAAAKARSLGMSHIVTLDADGQHLAADLPRFIRAVCEEPHTLFVGVRDFSGQPVPFSSRFGRAFSNFWFRVQSSTALSDTQCGYRAYPLDLFDCVRLTERRYSFETEVLVRAAWTGFALRDLPVAVYYPPPEERVSHFKALADNLRISLLNTRLTMRALMPVPHRKYTTDAQGRVSLLHPMRSLRILLAARETPRALGYSAALGMALGTLPLPGLHSMSILLAAGSLRLNALLALAVSQLCMPPLVPALCIETGYFLRNGTFLYEISLRTLGYEVLDRLFEWVIGSLVLAPIFALIMGLIVYVPARFLCDMLAGKPKFVPVSGTAEEQQ